MTKLGLVVIFEPFIIVAFQCSGVQSRRKHIIASVRTVVTTMEPPATTLSLRIEPCWTNPRKGHGLDSCVVCQENFFQGARLERRDYPAEVGGSNMSV